MQRILALVSNRQRCVSESSQKQTPHEIKFENVEFELPWHASWRQPVFIQITKELRVWEESSHRAHFSINKL